MSGDAGTLYQCSGGNLGVAHVCDNGCPWMPTGVDDPCAAGGGGASCAGYNDGLYCY